MEVKVLKEGKDSIEIETDNLTIAEIVRAYAWKNKKVVLAGWRREHPTKPIVLVLKTKEKPRAVLKEIVDDISSKLSEIRKNVKK
jgi:DNA-directed RNA polymerase subunit L